MRGIKKSMGRPKGSKNKSGQTVHFGQKTKVKAEPKMKTRAAKTNQDGPMTTMALNLLAQTDRITAVEKTVASLFSQLNKVVTEVNQVIVILDKRIQDIVTTFQTEAATDETPKLNKKLMPAIANGEQREEKAV